MRSRSSRSRKFNHVCGLVACLLLVTACQTPVQTGFQCTVEPGYLDGVTKFAWVNDDAIDVIDETGYVSPIVEKSLAKAVAAELNSKGFSHARAALTLADADQEIRVAIVLRTRRELVSVESSPSPCIDSDCWERIDTASSTRMDIRTIGFLAADVFFQGEPIWRGWVETNLYPADRDRSAEVIAKVIPQLFANFPP